MVDTDRCPGSDLCDELAGGADTSFNSIYQGNPSSRNILEADQLRLIADLSPLAVGHMLLLPVGHYLSFAHVMRSSGADVQQMLRCVLPRYERTFGPPAILEHGSSTDMNAAACITHAHWHLLPIDGREIDKLMSRDGLKGTEIETPGDLARLADRDAAYFYCSYATTHKIYGAEGPTRRQYIRSLVGEVLGIPEPLWDYALVVRKELLRATVQRATEWVNEVIE